MVMKRNMMRKNLRQSILKSLGRYIAIVAIIALGSSMFVGLRMTRADMVATGQKYMDDQNMFDLRLVSSYGWDQSQLEQIRQLEGVVDAAGIQYLDAIAKVADGEEAVYRFYSISDQMNRIALRGGRMPEAPDECLADGFIFGDKLLGQEVTITETNSEDTLDSLVSHTYTVVGYVATPLYMDINRGTTSIGSGSLTSFFYIPRSSFEMDYYTEIHVTIPGDYDIYTAKYNDAMDAAAEALEPQLESLAEERLVQLKQDAERAYITARSQFMSGKREYLDGKAEAEAELADARSQLEDAEQQIKDNEQLLIDGEKQIEDGRKMLQQSEQTLRDSKQMLAKSKADAYSQLAAANSELLSNYKTVNSSLQQVNTGILQLNAGMIELNTGITQLESGLSQLDNGIMQIDLLIGIMNTSITTAQTALDLAKQAPEADLEKIAELEAELQKLVSKRDEYSAQRADLAAQRETYNAQLQDLYAKRTELETQQAELEATKKQLDEAMAAIDAGFLELQTSQTQVENQLAAADAQMEAGAVQIESGYAQLEEQAKQLEEGKAELEEAKLELEDGWEEFYEGEAEALQELADAEAEILDAEAKLQDARETIDAMTENDIYVLNRTSNIGYNSLDSASQIVSGVSRVFPVFFLLVAALVCITTMTRMVDEERTQIGTLKALGYSNGAIISKYLIYAGSGAVVGCGLGVILGSIIFPTILWYVYQILLYVTPDVVITFDWVLCFVVVGAYTAVMLLTTWYCCKRALEEEPAELIRPRPPTSGKKIFMERLPFWDKISFLNKVAIRNIFRYRQRLLMMMVGIGGCSALLLTGFGLRDSIVNVVDFQFEEITLYDMGVYFSEGQTPEQQAEFLEEMEDYTENILFFHQSSVEVDFDDQTKEVYLFCADDTITDFMDFHRKNTPLDLPGENEALLSVGVAEAMGISTGDSVVLRNSDMEILEVTVSGIYDNHVNNYAIVNPETVEAQWGYTPAQQMAIATIGQDQDVYAAGVVATEFDGVMNVSVNEDTAEMVRSMLDALDLVVLVVVICAGLLAVIVLYNLININITERLREIATIKVLGFHAGETASYVFKENFVLTVMGAILGLGLGRLLLEFVMSQIKIDMVWFRAWMSVGSCVIAVVLTVLAAIVVEFIFYFKLEKINMAEALKSVE